MKSHGIKSPSLRTVLQTMLSADVPVISVGEAALQSGTAVFLDSREAEEYGVSHLPKAVWIGYNDFHLARLKHIPFHQPIVVYCSIGKRSDTVAKTLLRAGYTNVQNLAGGIFEWVNQGHSVYRGEEETAAVHVFNRFWGRWLKRGTKVY